jgi:hypothetical protein
MLTAALLIAVSSIRQQGIHQAFKFNCVRMHRLPVALINRIGGRPPAGFLCQSLAREVCLRAVRGFRLTDNVA